MFRRNKETLSERIRSDRPIGLRRQLSMVVSLSVPAILAQLSAVIMEYIDASMVGSLGADASASIGLVATSTWLFMGLCSASAVGFSVQVAHLLGAGDQSEARSVLRQSLVATLLFSSILAVVGLAISGRLPGWLGGVAAINRGATLYFAIFAATLPVLTLSFLSGAMLRSSGNMFVPGLLSVVMCVLDVVFNFFTIFPTREVTVFSMSFTVVGAGWGVAGAAVGTALAELLTALLMLWYLWFRSPELSLRRRSGSFMPRRRVLRRAFTIGMPMGIERFITSAAQITLTVIVAPLGIASIAANAFAITAESLCYMPGYGISDAATALVGQSLGAGRKDLARRFGWLTVWLGMAVMTVMGVVMYMAAPLMIGVMTPDPEILSLGVMALRVEAWAEPMFAASIVAYGVFVGAGDTVVPCVMNLGSIWVIRITLAALLAPVMGLKGVWVAMCIELCCRGLMFLLRMKSGRWLKSLV